MQIEFLENVINNKPALALIYILLTIIIAYIVDKIFIASLRILVRKSPTDIDDKILDFIHKPVYYSILFFGFNIAVNFLNIPASMHFYFTGIMKSIVIILWAIALFRSFMIFVQWSSKNTKSVPFIQPKLFLFLRIWAKYFYFYSLYIL
mgnify:CR=1 FL=1